MNDPVTPLTPEELAAREVKAGEEGYVHRDLVSVNIATNTFLGGRPDETLSSRAARAAEAGKLWGKVASKFLNFFQPNHGPKAQAGDLERAENVEKLEENSGGFQK